MQEGEKPRCNPDDVLCQMQILGHLRAMKSIMGDSEFQSNYPEFSSLSDIITERIVNQEGNLRMTLQNCGILAPGESTEAIEPEIFIEQPDESEEEYGP